MLRIIGLYLKWIIGAPRDPVNADAEGIAGWCLVNKPTFRLPSTASSDRFIALRQWKKAISARPEVELPAVGFGKGKDGITWVFDNRAVTETLRMDHVSVSTDQPVSFFAARDQVTGMKKCRRAGDAFWLTLVLPWLLVWSFFSSRRAAIAMLFVEWREGIALLRLARLYDVDTFYFFCPFEKDANALYLLLKRESINVAKIPSPSLLGIHHTLLLSDTLVLTSPYQEDELETFKQTVRISKIERWVPETFLTYGSRYNTWLPSQKNTIGFYSHATWLRLAEGHGGSGENELNAEVELLPVLAAFMRKHPSYELLLFLHPKEKKNDREKVNAFYEKAFAGVNYRFANETVPSPMQFEAAETGVGAISTILFERLFTGYKTILYPVGIPNFPVKESLLNRICPTTPEGLEKALLEALGKEESGYFSETGLSRYTRRGWIK